MLEESLGYFPPKNTELQSQVTHGDFNSKKRSFLLFARIISENSVFSRLEEGMGYVSPKSTKLRSKITHDDFNSKRQSLLPRT